MSDGARASLPACLAHLAFTEKRRRCRCQSRGPTVREGAVDSKKENLNMLELFMPRRKSNNVALKIVVGATLALIVAGVVVSLPDIKRYIKISTM